MIDSFIDWCLDHGGLVVAATVLALLVVAFVLAVK